MAVAAYRQVLRNFRTSGGAATTEESAAALLQARCSITLWQRDTCWTTSFASLYGHEYDHQKTFALDIELVSAVYISKVRLRRLAGLHRSSALVHSGKAAGDAEIEGRPGKKGATRPSARFSEALRQPFGLAFRKRFREAQSHEWSIYGAGHLLVALCLWQLQAARAASHVHYWSINCAPFWRYIGAQLFGQLGRST